MHRGCLLAMLLILSIAGCGGNSSVKSAKIGGKVTLDTLPVENGTINFTPKDGMGPSAGGLITNGSYSVDVPLGSKRIAVFSPKAVGSRKKYNTPDSPEEDVYEESVPPRFNTETTLDFDVTERKSDLNFDLKSATDEKKTGESK